MLAMGTGQPFWSVRGFQLWGYLSDQNNRHLLTILNLMR